MNPSVYRYIDEHSISRSLFCPICFDVLLEPYIHIECDSAFCLSCLFKLVEPSCPICRIYLGSVVPQYENSQLCKANRLIRNMLDELLVKCQLCHCVRPRGQFEHQCQLVEEKQAPSKLIFSIGILLLWIFVIYYNRYTCFVNIVDRHQTNNSPIGINIDQYIFKFSLYLIERFIEYNLILLVANLFIRFSIHMYIDRWISKGEIEILRKFLEVSIMFQLIIYSIYH
jgi:hypothetical protein